MADLEIVLAPLDIDNHLNFVIAAHRETFYITFRIDITDDFLKMELERMKKDSVVNKNSVIAAFIGKEIVGLAVLETRNHADNSEFGWIHFYYVSPQFRRQGIGLRLVGYSVEYFSALGLKEIYLRTGEHNITAQEFYLNVGFSRVPEGDGIALNGVNELMMRYNIIKPLHS